MNTVFKMATLFPGSLKAEQDANFACFTMCALLPIFPEDMRGVLDTGVNLDTCWIGVETGKFDFGEVLRVLIPTSVAWVRSWRRCHSGLSLSLVLSLVPRFFSGYSSFPS